MSRAGRVARNDALDPNTRAVRRLRIADLAINFTVLA